MGGKHLAQTVQLRRAGRVLPELMQKLHQKKARFKKFFMPGKSLLQGGHGLVRAPGFGQQAGQRIKDLGVGLQFQDFFIPIDFFRHGLGSCSGLSAPSKR